MRWRDGVIFRDVAKTHGVWVLVRRSNNRSLRYIGRTGYMPKRIDCKAKTAILDVTGRELAGLVVVPPIHVEAFTRPKRAKAMQCWQRFLMDHGVPSSRKAKPIEQGLEEAKSLNDKRGPYTVDLDERSRHYGCLMFQGRWIHGDYDLKDIIPVGQERRNIALVEELHGQPNMRGPKLAMVQDYVNLRIGVPMVQHGAEAQYADHADERVDVFGPNGQEFTLKNARQTKLWYDKMQRRVLAMAGDGSSYTNGAGNGNGNGTPGNGKHGR
jgi:hypothetical protein